MRSELRSSGARFLANLAYLVPGYRGYRDREKRREEDSRLRSLVLGRLGEIRESLTDLLAPPADRGPAPLWAPRLEEPARKLETIGDAVRYAPYGFSGFFDASSVREDTLERVLVADLLLFEDLDRIEALLGHVPEGHDIEAAVGGFLHLLNDGIERLERHLILRDKILGDA